MEPFFHVIIDYISLWGYAAIAIWMEVVAVYHYRRNHTAEII